MQIFYPLTSQNTLAAKVLAVVILRLFPNVILGGGGTNSLGFYYDFILEQPLTKEMLEFIEIHLQRFIKEAHSIRFISMMRENGQNLLKHENHFLLAQQAGKAASNIIDL